LNIRRLIGLLLIVLIVCGGHLPVQAVNRNLTFETLGIEADTQVGAPYASITFDFPVPRLAQVRSASATVSVTPNTQLNGDTIFFFYYNDKLVVGRDTNREGTSTTKDLCFEATGGWFVSRHSPAKNQIQPVHD